MQQQTIKITGISILPAGYGHNKVTVHTLSGSFSSTTSNTMLTDAYRSDDQDARWEEARVDLAKLALDGNDIEYSEIEF